MRLTKDEFFQYVSAFCKMSEEEERISNVLGATEWSGRDWVDSYIDLILNMLDIPENKDYLCDSFFDYTNDFTGHGVNREACDELYDMIVKEEEEE